MFSIKKGTLSTCLIKMLHVHVTFYHVGAYTSQRCSNCGAQIPTNRRSRGLYQCQTCALHLNADINAARNLRNTFLYSLSSPQVVLREKFSSQKPFSPDSGGVAPPVQMS